MAKEKEILKEQERQERVNETVSKTDQFFRENKKTIYTIFLTLLVLGLAFVAWYKFIYQPKCQEATAQMFPAEANFRNGESDLALNGDGNVLGFSIGDAYVGLEKYGDALNYFEKAAAQADNMFAASYLLKAGVVCEETGDNAKALSFYKQIKDKYPQSMEGYDIDKYITRIESQEAK